MYLDKTTAVLGGAYGIIVLVLVFAFVFEQQKTDPTQQTSILGSLVQSSPGSQLSLADLFAKSQDGVVQIIVRKTGDNS